MLRAFEHTVARIGGWVDHRMAWFLTNGCKQSLRHGA